MCKVGKPIARRTKPVHIATRSVLGVRVKSSNGANVVCFMRRITSSAKQVCATGRRGRGMSPEPKRNVVEMADSVELQREDEQGMETWSGGEEAKRRREAQEDRTGRCRAVQDITGQEKSDGERRDSLKVLKKTGVGLKQGEESIA